MPSTEGFQIVRGGVTTLIRTDALGPYHCENIAPLYEVVASELVNWPIAGAFEQPNPPALTGTRIALTVQALGMFDLVAAAVTEANYRSQLLANIKHLISDVVAPVEVGDGTATFELFGVGGASEGTAAVQFVGGLRPVQVTPDVWAVTFDMYFPTDVPVTGVGS